MRALTSNTLAFDEYPRSISASNHDFIASHGGFLSSCVVDNRTSSLRSCNHIDKVCRFESHFHISSSDVNRNEENEVASEQPSPVSCLMGSDGFGGVCSIAFIFRDYGEGARARRWVKNSP